MRITMLAAGAAGMYCGSCMRDNAAAAALICAGHDVLLVPLYTPLRTDEAYVGSDRVFYGALNVYLGQVSRLFRRLPASVGKWLDRPAMLRWVGRFAGSTSAAQLGALAVDVLRGAEGNQVRELSQLLDFLAGRPTPDVIHLPNLLFLGVAGPLKRRLHAPLVCTLSGEDGFVGNLPEPHRSEVMRLIHEAAGQVDAFVATSQWLADRSIEVFDLPADRMHVIWTGINGTDFAKTRPTAPGRPPTVGYLARITPAKGLDILATAMGRVLNMDGLSDSRLTAAGYLGPGDRKWFHAIRQRIIRAGWDDRFDYIGEVDRQGKIDLLTGIDCFCLPARHPEGKAIPALEAMAAGLPVVAPARGCFPELLNDTGGGVLVPSGHSAALADALADLLRNAGRRAVLGAAGQSAVLERYTTENMAARLAELYASLK